MNCKQINKWLPLYVSGDLDAPMLEEIDSHLGECLPCNREFQNYNKSLDSLKNLGEKPDLSLMLEGFSDEIMEKIENDKGGAVAPVPRVTYSSSSFFAGSNFSRNLAAAAMVLVLISAGIYLMNPGAGTSEPEFGPPGGNLTHETATPGEPGMKAHDSGIEALSPTHGFGQPSHGAGQPFLVSEPYTTIDPAARAKELDPTAEEESDEPYLDPLPHKFPRVQPVEYKRDF